MMQRIICKFLGHADDGHADILIVCPRCGAKRVRQRPPSVLQKYLAQEKRVRESWLPDQFAEDMVGWRLAADEYRAKLQREIDDELSKARKRA